MKRELVLIGIGAGHPDWLTLAGVEAIQQLDVLFVVVKQAELDDLVEARRTITMRHRHTPLRTVELPDPPRPWQSTPDYPAAVQTWRAQRLEQWSRVVEAELGDGQLGGFLVWGDPGLYESTLAIVNQMAAHSARPLGVRVIPGISSVLALATEFRIPLNRQGRAVQIAPARLLADGMPDDVDDVVVMLDPKQTFASITPDGLDIYWAAYLGRPNQILISGDLASVRDEIMRVRAEAAQRHGWIFDTYLLRRR